MSSVVVYGVHFDVLLDMKRAIHDFFKSLFTNREPWRPEVDGLFLPSLQNSYRRIFRCRFMRKKLLKLLLIDVGLRPQADDMTMAFL